MQVLVVEDEKRLAQALGHVLEEQKYMVDIAFDGEDGYDYAVSGIYDIIILDVMLPKMNGYEVASRLRKEKIQTPILMLTAKDQISDKVKGLDSGADDYMTKPFAPEELLARVRALTRRQGEVIIDEITFSDVTLNLSTCDLTCGVKSVHLNFKEFEIMKILMQNAGIVTTKEDLIVKVWGYDSDAVDNNVEVYVSFLRKKLDFISGGIEIVSLRKIGYRLEVKEDVNKA
ncbi:MAG: response regulator transcription factor [Ruminococcaceae bacterium]|nr:response regulator transcription factor [Oscillospiraceae bacterium]